MSPPRGAPRPSRPGASPRSGVAGGALMLGATIALEESPVSVESPQISAITSDTSSFPFPPRLASVDRSECDFCARSEPLGSELGFFDHDGDHFLIKNDVVDRESSIVQWRDERFPEWRS